jgi:hypothetical protein
LFDAFDADAEPEKGTDEAPAADDDDGDEPS